MSQILDALRRAEAQRSRGRVPGLHESAGQVTLQPNPVPARGGANRALFLAGGVVLLALLVGLVVMSMRRGDPPAAVTPPVATNPPPTATAPAAPSVDSALQAPQPPAAASADALPAPAQPAPVIGLPRKAQLPERRVEAPREPAREAGREPAREASPGRLPGGQSPSSPAAPTTPRSAADEPRAAKAAPETAPLPTRQELPPDVQRGLPPITVSGSVYSTDPAQRMLVVNGEVWHEGDTLRPGLVLEQIRRRDAVLRYNGVRFTVGP